MSVSEEQQRHARFWKKFFRLTRGRIPVVRALAVIAEEESDPVLADIILQIRNDVNNGNPLSECMEQYKDVFSRSIRELVRSAEKTGAWDDILEEICNGLAEGTFD